VAVLSLLGVVTLLVLASLLVSATPAPPISTSSAHSPAATDLAGAASTPATHGDLVVTSGETFVIQPGTAGTTYYQEGNITVQAGGTLVVDNVTLSFVQFVGVTGNVQNRLGHIYKFTDDGKVIFNNANLTTDVAILNAYAKLNFTVTGSLLATGSTFEFPGWLWIDGASANATFVNSSVTGNPAVRGLTGLEPPTIVGDTEWAATTYVLGGAKLNLLGSSYLEVYEDNLQANGYPQPLSLAGPGVFLTGNTVINLTGPTTSAALEQGYLYPEAGAAGGEVTVSFFDLNGPGTALVSNNTAAKIGVQYDGTDYPLENVTFFNGTSGTVAAPFSPALMGAINGSGMVGLLNSTGSFGTPEGIFVTWTAVSGPPVSLLPSTVSFNTTGPNFDINVAGAGTTVTAADSVLDLNWSTVGALYSLTPPWHSNKMTFLDGSVGYLANDSIPTAVPGVFSTSAYLPDNSSSVFLYRWAEVNVTNGVGGSGISGAQVSVYYAYNSLQSNNATAARLNDLATADSELWSYVGVLDQERGTTGYGLSNDKGTATILVATTNLSGLSLPDGDYLGDYHVGVSVPGYTVPTHWFNWSLSAYPVGAALGTPGYGQPDYAPAQVFAGYKFQIRVESATAPPSTTLNLAQIYTTSGVVQYNGSQAATVTVYATPTSGGTPIPLGTASATSGTQFTVTWKSLNGVLSPGQSYTLSVTASAYGVTSAAYPILGTYSVPGPAPNFFESKFLGLPIWIWLAIVAAIIVALVAFLLLARRQAAGRLVECGECGNLIPEDATVCPKCGAEFEHDLIRCSRCASTIPADSKVCPECAAQLLGKPGEVGADPEAQGYADFTERYRAEGKRELGDNFSEGAFWDWWKRQPTYVSFSQWKLQQGSGTSRAGMTAPPAATAEEATSMGGPKAPPPGGAVASPSGGGATMMAPPPAASGGPAPPAAVTGAAATMAPGAMPGGPLKKCPSCGKEIPGEYLVCPFCGAVTQ
jgi:RNA polymerase subunit RPABC4/transcription elongation factor Spt4